MNCLHCHAETTNGLALCELCRRRAGDCLEYLPVYFRNLARWRRSGRPNGSLGTTNQWLIRRGESETNHVSRALERASNDITTWARALADDRGVELPDADTEAETITALCELLTGSLSSVATLEWAGQFVRDMDRQEHVLRRLTETYIPGWYAGECRHCQTPTFVMPGLTWVTCSGCGATTFARDRLDTIINEARDWVARPKPLAEAIVALVDTEPSVMRLYTRIRQWVFVGDLDPIMRTARDYVWNDEAKIWVVAEVPTGFARYRFGDVLDLALRRDTLIADETAVS